jgi:photosystem II stability/assembly factor-like uncharacterized protein
MTSVRFLLAISFCSATLLAQSPPTAESLRGVSVVSRNIIWLSGTHGTYLRTTDAGHTWRAEKVPGAEALDFRAVVAFSADEAFLMSSGTGDQARIYHTLDAGQHWKLQLTAINPKSFFDSMIFWDRTDGVVLGDPIADNPNKSDAKLHFELEMTEDGETWRRIAPDKLPEATPGEGAFAASNTCLAISNRFGVAQRLSAAIKEADSKGASAPDSNLWFATGGSVARVFHSPDRGQTWQVFDTPIVHGLDSAGIFSIAFRDALHGVIAGGDYKHPNQDGPNLAFTEDGGKTWTLPELHPQVFFTAAAYDLKSPGRLLIAATDFILDFRPPANPIRVNPPKKSPMKFNAISAYPEGGALVVGPKGAVLSIP